MILNYRIFHVKNIHTNIYKSYVLKVYIILKPGKIMIQMFYNILKFYEEFEALGFRK